MACQLLQPLLVWLSHSWSCACRLSLSPPALPISCHTLWSPGPHASHSQLSHSPVSRSIVTLPFPATSPGQVNAPHSQVPASSHSPRSHTACTSHSASHFPCLSHRVSLLVPLAAWSYNNSATTIFLWNVHLTYSIFCSFQLFSLTTKHFYNILSDGICFSSYMVGSSYTVCTSVQACVTIKKKCPLW